MKLKKRLSQWGNSPRNILGLVAVFVIVLAFFSHVFEVPRVVEQLSYSEFLDRVETDKVKSAKIVGNEVLGTTVSGQSFHANVPDDPNLWVVLRAHKVNIDTVKPVTDAFGGFWYFVMLMVIGFVIVFVWYLIRQGRGGSGGGGGSNNPFNMGKSRAQMFLPSQIKVKFADVAGADEAKEELRDIVEFLKNPTKYKRLGAELTRGILLVGEPGNGKTMLARAVAGEANCPFFSITGSDFIEMFVGVGAARIRDMFAQARRHTPCIVFIDEIDAIGRRRGGGLGGGHDEREQALNQLLTEMDGFASGDTPLVVIAATNMPSVLDRALLRPGRFDRRITVPFPDEKARRALIENSSRKITLGPDVNLELIVEKSAGFSGADLANCVNQAALYATKNGRDMVTQEDFDVAFKKLQESQKASRGEHKTDSSEESMARVYMPSQMKVRFSDVAGLHEAKEELQDFISYLKNPEKYKKIGARLTRGVLLVGEPGNGKTLLARAVAGEAGRPFFSASGSEFIEKYVGVGAARVRDLFAQARKHTPSIIFIDEIDAIGGKRGEEGGSHNEGAQTLNQLLTEMDGFDDEVSVIVLAATNRPDMLDKALVRAGRFDRQVEVPYPDLKARREVLDVHVRNIKLAPDVDLEKVARGTPGFSGADIANLVNEAAIHAVNQGRETAGISDFEEARDKIIMGKKSKSMVQLPEDLKATAYHESGHALMTLLQPESTDPLHKVTIAPRGRALGYAASLPERDRYSKSKQELIADIICSLGGRVGEEIGVGKQFTGVTSDLRHASELARRMVCEYGMSEQMGLVSYRCDNQRALAPETAAKIDSEIQSILQSCYEKAKSLLMSNRDKLETLTQALLEKETLSAEEIYQLLGIEPRTVHAL
jgi:cell division protease FtsH